MRTIEAVHARQILDSRSPTIDVDLQLAIGAAEPSSCPQAPPP